MEHLPAVPSLSTAESEEFFTSGSDARTSPQNPADQLKSKTCPVCGNEIRFSALVPGLPQISKLSDCGHVFTVSSEEGAVQPSAEFPSLSGGTLDARAAVGDGGAPSANLLRQLGARRLYRKAVTGGPIDGCCAGEDIPGVGLVHSEGCPEAVVYRPVGQDAILTSESESVVSKAAVQALIEHALRDMRDTITEIDAKVNQARERIKLREKISITLALDARDLAGANLAPSPIPGRQVCLECSGIGRPAHAASCRTGRVLRDADQFFAIGDTI